MNQRKRITMRKSVARHSAASGRQKTDNVRLKKNPQFPFSAIVGQDAMKLALILNVIDPSIGGVLIMGHRGTGKSTAVRGLAELLPEIEVVSRCTYRCDPNDRSNLCDKCVQLVNTRTKLKSERAAVKVVDLPLGATEDRVCGTIDLEQAIRRGAKAFETGLLAQANRGFLYIDEVNLLEDHLVDVLLDAAATGRNRVEREGISIEHPARFVLVGSGNPEEGELRPQLQDRFGFYVDVTTENSADLRMRVVEQRVSFEQDPEAFLKAARSEQEDLRRQISQACSNVHKTRIARDVLRQIADVCSELRIDGHRGELTIARGARALAAFENRRQVDIDDVRKVAVMSLRHRLRRDPLEETAGATQINNALDRILSREQGSSSNGDGNPTSSNRNNGRGKQSAEGPARAKTTMSSSPEGRVGREGNSTLPIEFTSNEQIRDLKIAELNHVPSSSCSRKVRGQQRNHSKSDRIETGRGRYQRASNFKTASVALDATLRVAVIKHMTAFEPTKRLTISDDSLRYKILTRKQGPLYIFTIDASGSMARSRIATAKRILLGLLKRSYINRDRVAIISFSGTTAKILLSPSSSILRARRVLDSLVVGGGTPLSAGLRCSLELAKRVARHQGLSTVLLLFTDGGANVSFRKPFASDRIERERLIDEEIEFVGLGLRRAGINVVVVNAQDQFRSDYKACELSTKLKAQLFSPAKGYTPVLAKPTSRDE